MQTRPVIELPLLAAIWGGSFLLMKYGVPEFGAAGFMATRTLIAALLLLVFLAAKKQVSELWHNKFHLFVLGSFSTAIPFVLFGWATLTLSAGTTSVLNSTTPMFGALIAYFWLKDKLSFKQGLGLTIGFSGVYVLVQDKIQAGDAEVILPTLAVLLATFCYGVAANYTKKYLSHLGSLALATGSQVAASISLVPIALFYLPDSIPSERAIWSALAIGVICTGFAYIIFFRILKGMGPTNAMSVTYLIPLFGIFWGYMFLQEPISINIIAGGLLILFGIALTTGALNPKKILRKKPA